MELRGVVSLELEDLSLALGPRHPHSLEESDLGTQHQTESRHDGELDQVGPTLSALRREDITNEGEPFLACAFEKRGRKMDATRAALEPTIVVR